LTRTSPSKFNDDVFHHLEEQDALRNKQQYEKQLTKQIKELKQKYNQVIIEFNTETEDTQKNIEKFKKDKAKELKIAATTKAYLQKTSVG